MNAWLSRSFETIQQGFVETIQQGFKTVEQKRSNSAIRSHAAVTVQRGRDLSTPIKLTATKEPRE
jgi:hypothetical protein